MSDSSEYSPIDSTDKLLKNFTQIFKDYQDPLLDEIENMLEALKPFASVELDNRPDDGLERPCFTEASVIIARDAHHRAVEFLKTYGRNCDA